MTQRHLCDRGFSLVEVVVTVGLLSILLGAAVPHLRGPQYGLLAAHTMLVADLRMARADAISRGDHFAIVVTGTTDYELRRLRDDDGDGNWVADKKPLQLRTLPDGIAFASGANATLEFNTRGLLVSASAAKDFVLTEAKTSHTKTVTVWPSGQVSPEESS